MDFKTFAMWILRHINLRSPYTLFAPPIFFGVLLIINYQVINSNDFFDYEDFYLNTDQGQKFPKSSHNVAKDDIPHPIILWWTYFTGEKGRVRKCGDVECFTTNNRQYLDHPNTRVLLFYGTDFKLADLPIPRMHEWGLLHEESPKNNYLMCHNDTISLFNHSATFKRNSDVPLTTQYLKHLNDLTDIQHYKTTHEKNERLKDLALINYVQSDCDAPSDRDHFVQMLQRYIPVDSYGACLHNKNLSQSLQDPLDSMDHSDFYELLSHYKFTLALENAVCEDYVTEKFWRPFIVGSVPIVFGSPKAKDLCPNPQSAIFVSDFPNIEDLVSFILHLNSSKDEYDKYLRHKTDQVVTNPLLKDIMKHRKWGVNDWNKPDYVDTFECTVCQRMHENIRRQREGLKPHVYKANGDHYGCPKPLKFSDNPPGNLTRVEGSVWGHAWERSSYVAKALKTLVKNGRLFTKFDVLSLASELRYISSEH